MVVMKLAQQLFVNFQKAWKDQQFSNCLENKKTFWLNIYCEVNINPAVLKRL